MAWTPNRKLGYAMWAGADCAVCGAVAHYRVGSRGFCRRHKHVAESARSAYSLAREVDSAIAERDFNSVDKTRRIAEKNKAANGKPKGGFK